MSGLKRNSDSGENVALLTAMRTMLGACKHTFRRITARCTENGARGGRIAPTKISAMDYGQNANITIYFVCCCYNCVIFLIFFLIFGWLLLLVDTASGWLLGVCLHCCLVVRCYRAACNCYCFCGCWLLVGCCTFH